MGRQSTPFFLFLPTAAGVSVLSFVSPGPERRSDPRLPGKRVAPPEIGSAALTGHTCGDEDRPLARCRVGEELGDETRLLLGRKRAQRVHEVAREARVVLRSGPEPLVGGRGNRVGRADVGEARRQAGRGVGVGRVAGSEALTLRGTKEVRAASADGPAQGDRQIVPPELGLGDVRAVQEELVRVQLFVLEEVGRGARKPVRARPRDQLDVAAAVAPARGRRQRRLDLHFVERLERDADSVPDTTASARSLTWTQGA